MPLRSLGITGFRALADLEIPHLAMVNLIVGKNSTGKTTVLEAIRLLLSTDIRTRLYTLLAERDEWSFKRWQAASRLNTSDTLEMSFESLFSGRPDLTSEPQFFIGDRYSHDFLRVNFEWLRQERREDASVRYVPSEGPRFDLEAVPGLHATRPDNRLTLPLDRLNRLALRRSAREISEAGVVYLKSSGMHLDDIGRMWDSVALTDDEDRVVDALRIITPSLEKLVMVQSPESRSERLLMAKVREFSAPIPFKSLGEGANHLLSIALGVIQARGTTLLIDEIASGIHYTVQRKLWELILQQSAEYRTQVFATTHSWDCVKALHHAGIGPYGSDVALHRLETRGPFMRAVSFSADELAIADEEEIEVR